MQFFAAAVVALFLLIIWSFGPGENTGYQTANEIDTLSSEQSEYPYPLPIPLPATSYTDPYQTEAPDNPQDSPAPDSPAPLPIITTPKASVVAEFSAPSLYDVLRLGETYPIRWQLSDSVKKIRIRIYESGVSECGYDTACLGSYINFVKSYWLTSGQDNTGSISWQIGKTAGQDPLLPPGQYNLRIETEGGQILGDSETFAIITPNQPDMIDVAVPYDPSTMPYEADPLTYSSEVDFPHSILWRSTPSIFFVDIFVRSREGSGLYQIARSIPNGFLYGWYPGRNDVNGNKIPPGDYELYIQDVKNTLTISDARVFKLE